MNLTRLMSQTRIPPAILAAIFGLTIFAAAQEAPERPRRPAPRPDVSQRESKPGVRRPGSFPEDVLNEDQRAALREIVETNRERMRELDEKIQHARQDLDKATFADQVDEELIRQKVDALSRLESERILIRAKAFARIRPTLTPEQAERIKNRQGNISPGRGPRTERPPAEERGRRPEARPDQPVRPRAEARLRERDRSQPEARPEDTHPPRPETRFREPKPERFRPRSPDSFREPPSRDRFHRPEGPEFDRGRPGLGGPPARFEARRERFPRREFRRPEDPERFRPPAFRQGPEFRRPPGLERPPRPDWDEGGREQGPPRPPEGRPG